MYQKTGFRSALEPNWKSERIVILTVITAFAMFLLDILLGAVFPKIQLKTVFWLMRSDLLGSYAFFQLFTYMFFHAGFFHLFFNMLIIWMMGRELEHKLGNKTLLFFVVITALCGGVLHTVFSPLPVIGASAVVFGMMLLYAFFWPNRQIYVFFVFPVKVKYLVAVLALVEFVFSIQSLSRIGSGRVSHWAHLGGVLAAGLWLLWYKRLEIRFFLKKKAERRELDKHRLRVENRIKEKQQVDLLLDKISAEGMESLTGKEKRFLDRASKQFYDDKKDPGGY